MPNASISASTAPHRPMRQRQGNVPCVAPRRNRLNGSSPHVSLQRGTYQGNHFTTACVGKYHGSVASSRFRVETSESYLPSNVPTIF